MLPSTLAIRSLAGAVSLGLTDVLVPPGGVEPPQARLKGGYPDRSGVGGTGVGAGGLEPPNVAMTPALRTGPFAARVHAPRTERAMIVRLHVFPPRPPPKTPKGRHRSLSGAALALRRGSYCLSVTAMGRPLDYDLWSWAPGNIGESFGRPGASAHTSTTKTNLARLIRRRPTLGVGVDARST